MRTLRGALAAAALLLAAACGQERAPAASRAIPIGFFGALTGPQATFAQSGRNGARLAFDERNRSGGVLGQKLDLVVEDDHNEPSEAASVVTKLITRDQVVALIGENASSRSLAAAPIAQQYRVPMVSPSSTNVEVTKKGDYVFRVCFIDSSQGRAVATFARRTLGAGAAALLVDVKSDYSVGLADAIRREFMASGGRIVAEQRYAEGDSDFSAQLTALRSQSPDVLFIPGYYTDAGLIARQARALGVAATIVGADGFDSPKLVEIGGPAVEGVYFSNHYTPDDPSKAVREFVAVYRKAFGGDPDSIAALSYDAARLIADAIQRAGSTEGKRIRDALAETRDFAGVTGRIAFDADRNPVKPVVILKVEGGRFRYAATVGP